MADNSLTAPSTPHVQSLLTKEEQARKDGRDIVLNSTVPWYVRDTIGQDPNTTDTGLGGLANMLNPFRGIPNSFYGDPPAVGPAEQDPAYQNRLQAAVDGGLVRSPQGYYGFPLNSTNAQSR